jgi:hypothetical protein
MVTKSAAVFMFCAEAALEHANTTPITAIAIVFMITPALAQK